MECYNKDVIRGSSHVARTKLRFKPSTLSNDNIIHLQTFVTLRKYTKSLPTHSTSIINNDLQSVQMLR